MQTLHIEKLMSQDEGYNLDISRYFDKHASDAFGVFTTADDETGIGQVLCGTVVEFQEGKHTLKLLLVASQDGKTDLLRRRHKGVKQADVVACLKRLDGWLVVGMTAATMQAKPDPNWPSVPTLWFGVVRKRRWVIAGCPTVLDMSEAA